MSIEHEGPFLDKSHQSSLIRDCHAYLRAKEAAEGRGVHPSVPEPMEWDEERAAFRTRTGKVFVPHDDLKGGK